MNTPLELVERERQAVARIANGIRQYGTYAIGVEVKTVPGSEPIDCPVCSTVGEKHKMLLREEQVQAVSPMRWRMCTSCGFNYPASWDVSGPRTVTLIGERQAQRDKTAADL